MSLASYRAAPPRVKKGKRHTTCAAHQCMYRLGRAKSREADVSLEGLDLERGEWTVGARCEIGEQNRTETDSDQLFDRMADGVTHLSDFVVASLAQGDFDPGLALAAADGAEIGRSAQAAVSQTHAVFQFGQHARPTRAGQLGMVGPGDLIARMQQAGGQLAVIGQQQQPGRVIVEPTDRKDALADLAEQLTDRWSPFRVGQGADHTGRFVEQKIQPRRVEGDGLAVNNNGVASGVCGRSQPGDRLAVDLDLAGLNQCLGFPA